MPISKSQLINELVIGLKELLPEKKAKELKLVAENLADHLLAELAPDIYEDEGEDDPQGDADLLDKIDESGDGEDDDE